MTVYPSRFAYLRDREKAKAVLKRMGFENEEALRVIISGTREYSCEITIYGRVVAEPKITACICPGVWD